MPSEGARMEVRGVRKTFGGLAAVDGVDLTVGRGSMTGLIGPNGAGKTTLFSLLAGFLRPDAGTILLDGEDITRKPPHRRARLGLVRTFQITRPLARMTVEENLRLAPLDQLGERGWAPLLASHLVAKAEADMADRVDAMLDFFELRGLRSEYAGALSGGQRKLLEIARALMLDPRIILLDEPFAGVNPTLARKILEKVETLRKERGLTFLLIEHDLETVFGHCEPIVVMANGRKIAEGSAQEIRADKNVVEAYLGGVV